MNNEVNDLEAKEYKDDYETYFDWDLFEAESGFHCCADVAADYCGC